MGLTSCNKNKLTMTLSHQFNIHNCKINMYKVNNRIFLRFKVLFIHSFFEEKPEIVPTNINRHLHLCPLKNIPSG